MKWVIFGLWYALCVVHFEYQLSCILHYREQGFHFPAYLQIIQMWELHASALCSLLTFRWTFSLLLLKASLHLSDSMKLASLSPSKIKSKEFNRSEEPECQSTRSFLTFILHQNTLSVALITALRYFEQNNWIRDEHAALPLFELVCCLLLIKSKSFLQCFL